jgi:general secretion pathway protein G
MKKSLRKKIEKWFKTSSLDQESGFTLTEMLIVIALIAMVGTFVVSNLTSKFTKAKVDSTKIQIKQLGVILDDFKRECGFYPTTDQGLEALIRKPSGGRDCRNYNPDGYIADRKIPKDGFGNDFLYESDGNNYKITSLGNDNAQGGAGNDSDIFSDQI